MSYLRGDEEGTARLCERREAGGHRLQRREAAARARVRSITLSLPLSLLCVCESKIRLQFDLEPGWD